MSVERVPDGPLLTVFLHGFSGHATSWDTVSAKLPETERALAITLWGHDGEENPDSTTFEREVDRVAERIGREGARRIRVCGYSLGGRIALGLLIRHPGIADSAVLIGAHPGIEADGERAARAANDATWCQLATERGIVAFIDAWEKQPLFATQERLPMSVLRAQRTSRLRHTAQGLARAMKDLSLSAMPSYWPHLSDIGVPVLVLVGEDDAKFSAVARRIMPLLQNGALRMVPKVGHNVVLEQPAAILEALSSIP